MLYSTVRFVDIAERGGLNRHPCLYSRCLIQFISVSLMLRCVMLVERELGLQRVSIPMEDAGACISLAFSKRDETAIILGPRDTPTEERPMLYAANIEKARDLLISCGVSVNQIAEDRQGTQYFTMRDLESNELARSDRGP